MELQQILAAFAANPNLKNELLESLSADATAHLTGKKGMIVKPKGQTMTMNSLSGIRKQFGRHSPGKLATYGRV